MKSVEKESAKKESEKGKYTNTNSDLREPGELWESTQRALWLVDDF